MIGLKHPYPSVDREGGSYGGSQLWSEQSNIRRCGCGLVAGTDLLLYLHRTRPDCQSTLFRGVPAEGLISQRRYRLVTERVERAYLPLLPMLGMNGWMLTVGLNRHFRKEESALRSRWGVWEGRLRGAIAEMLERDIPVILSIGTNFPKLWQDQRVQFYIKKTSGAYHSVCGVKAHFVTITGMDERWLRVSSWGKEYYVDFWEFARYVKKHSNSLFSNIVYIKEKKPGRNEWFKLRRNK